MNPFTFQTPPNILFEPGAVEEGRRLVAEFGAKRVLLVTDKGVRSAGLTRDAEEVSQRRPDVTSSCSRTCLPTRLRTSSRRAVALCRDEADRPRCSRSAAAAPSTRRSSSLTSPSSDERLDDIYGVGIAKGQRLPLAARADDGRDRLGGDADRHRHDADDREEGRRLAPPPAGLGDPRPRTDARPARACHGGDGHRRHGACDRGLYEPAQEEPDVGSTRAAGVWRFCRTNIREVCRNGANLEARSQMLLGSMLAGMAFANAPVAAVHALAYPIGAIFHVPHGLSNALVLMGVLRFNLPDAEGSMRELAPDRRPRRAGSSCGAGRACASWTRSPRSAATAACRRRLRRSASGEERSRAPRRGCDEADAAAREQPARGHLRGRVRNLQRGTRRQERRQAALSDGEVRAMNPFESMQALADAVGQGRRPSIRRRPWRRLQGDGRAGQSSGEPKHLARDLRFQASRRRASALTQVVVRPQANSRPRSPTDFPAADGRKPSDPVGGGNARQDLRSARLALGHERGRRGAPAHG